MHAEIMFNMEKEFSASNYQATGARRPGTFVQLEQFKRGWIVDILEFGLSSRKIYCVCRRCFDVSNSGQMNIPTPVDQVLDGRILQTYTEINALSL